MRKAPSMQDLQAALADPANFEDASKPTGKILPMPTLEMGTFKAAVMHVANVALNVLAVAGIVLTIVGLSILGDRIYLSTTDTGTSKFETFLKKQGYYQQALAFKQQHEACKDTSNTLNLCKGATWLYLHPEIAVWPTRSMNGPVTVAQIPRR